jgi:hypothetical protein
MAKLEFLLNLKTARNLFDHRVETDDPGLDPRSVEAQLKRGTIWLTPSSMQGFNVRDFPELAPDLRKRLKENVERFVRIAKQVPPTKPATPEQVRDAMAAFQEVLEILKPYLSSPGEPEKIVAALEKIRFPECVLNWNFELDIDSTGDPAVRIWVFVDDQAMKREDFTRISLDIERKILDAFSAAGIERWPYVSFRSASEQRALRRAYPL